MKERKDYMTSAQKQAMGNSPRNHYLCIERTGVARPGKTAHDRAKRAGRVDTEDS